MTDDHPVYVQPHSGAAQSGECNVANAFQIPSPGLHVIETGCVIALLEAVMLQLADPSFMRLRILISLSVGTISGFLCWFLLTRLHQGAGDFGWAIRNAQFLLTHKNPYDTPFEQYPMTAAVFGLPFVWIRPELAGGLFYGVSSALLAFGLIRHGYHRLLVFASFPYCAGILTAQWGPLIAAAAFFPLLLPATLAKPQIGLPVILTRANQKGILACVLVLLATLALAPRWPWWWSHQFGHYGHYIPLLVLPGPLLLLALLRYRDSDARFLLLTAIMPQRWFYDGLILWLIPKTPRELIWTAFFSFGAGLWRWYHQPQSYSEVGRWAVIFLYLPMLAVVLLRVRKESLTNVRPDSTTPHDVPSK